MNQPNIEPHKKIGGSAFQDHKLNATRPVSFLSSRQPTKVISLADFCRGNFISRDTGYKLIKFKLIIAFRMYGQWWVRSNPDCIEELLEYLGLEELLFDADTD